MTIMELSVAVVALSALATGIAVVIGVSHLLPLIRDAGVLLRDANQTVLRINRIAEDAEIVVRDARKLETRLSATVGGVLDNIEPPLRWAGALKTAIRIGAVALLRSPPRKQA